MNRVAESPGDGMELYLHTPLDSIKTPYLHLDPRKEPRLPRSAPLIQRFVKVVLERFQQPFHGVSNDRLRNAEGALALKRMGNVIPMAVS
jgi:hypothetical protein